MEQIKKIVKQAFNIHGDKASYDEIHNRIVSGAEIKGTNLCILVLAIFIASIGLNMNSTAVIIGAMLISPLMGGIMAIGYGIATVDFKMVRNSAVGLTIQVIACLIISSLYFAISPIKTASSEILARTSPTIWDVLIACFGGLAGIIGTTREEKSNVIPGVAIATDATALYCRLWDCKWQSVLFLWCFVSVYYQYIFYLPDFHNCIDCTGSSQKRKTSCF